MRGLYLLHLEPPYKHARHYLGYSSDISRRVAEHMAAGSAASPLVRAALSAGSSVTLARTFEGGTRTFERKLKRRHNTPQLCPVCNSRLDVRHSDAR